MLAQRSGKQILDSRYQLTRPIASQDMSYVWLAEDMQQGNQRVAVKVLNASNPDGISGIMFERETLALERLIHPNIVRVIHSGHIEEPPWFYIVLEYLPLSLLSEIDSHRGVRDDGWSIPLLRKLAEAIAYAHGKDIIHRDLKPENVLLTEDGIPKLTDFGISRMKDRFTIGRTVARYHSPGYASPEQRAGGLCTEQSDIYSLGILFCHVLSGEAPSENGFPPAFADTLDAPPSVRRFVRRMISPAVEQRPGAALDVVRVFRSAERQLRPPPKCILVIPHPARAKLIAIGADSRDLTGWLTAELGIPDDDFPSVMFSSNGMTLLTDSYRLRCERRPHSASLEIMSVATPYTADLMGQRENALAPRIAWQPVLDASASPLSDQDESRQTLDDLSQGLRDYADEQSDERRVKNDRHNFSAKWDKVLLLQQKRLLGADKSFAYSSVEEGPDTLRFNLREGFQDDIGWVEGETPLAIHASNNILQPIGTLRSITGKQIAVNKMQYRGASMTAGNRTTPMTGFLQRDDVAERSGLTRQRNALKSLQFGETANPRLIDVLVDLRQAGFDAQDNTMTFIQPTLEPEKQEVVRAALAARDLFLIQGPPGTGKTTVIAEIVLQILRRQPDARILLTSQSNTAVDNALDRIAMLYQGMQPEIVRFGREERISSIGRDWLIDQRRKQWREEIVAHCDRVLESLSRTAQRQPLMEGTLSVETQENLDQCRLWLDETRELLNALGLDKERLATIMSIDAGNIGDASEHNFALHEGKALEASIAAAQSVIADNLASIRDLLSLPSDDVPLSDSILEIGRLVTRIAGQEETGTQDPQTHALYNLVSEWREVFGKTEDFNVPIMKRARIVGATCLAAGHRLMRGFKFDWVIVDEAARATALEVLVPLVGAKRAILVGDENQLSPIAEKNLSPKQLAEANISREELQTSLFETLVPEAARVRPELVRMLPTQHRMHPSIGRLVSEVFYLGKLSHAVRTEMLEHELPWFDRHVLWLSTSEERERRESQHGNTYSNVLEADTVVRLLERIEDTYREISVHRSVGIITGYSEQLALLTARVAPENGEKWQALSIEIATVDAFQGRECDLIVYSAVRSNSQGKLGFLSERKRLNVALSRARRLLVIVGDAEMLQQAEPDNPDNPFRKVLQYIETHPDDCRIEHVSRG